MSRYSTQTFWARQQGPMTLQEISNHVNLSRERVRQIIKESLEKLRNTIKKHNYI